MRDRFQQVGFLRWIYAKNDKWDGRNSEKIHQYTIKKHWLYQKDYNINNIYYYIKKKFFLKIIIMLHKILSLNALTLKNNWKIIIII